MPSYKRHRLLGHEIGSIDTDYTWVYPPFIPIPLIFTLFLCSAAYHSPPEVLRRRNRMDWIYLFLTLAFFGLSVLLVRGIEKLRRPS
jgi:hypothetical protein